MKRAAKYLEHNQSNISRLVVEHASLVKRIAHHLLSRLPSYVVVDDLIQSGMIGLIEAARNFDETKGASFATYAGIRIRGAMLDEIRRGDWAPRSVHKNTRRISEIIRNIENETGTEAKDDEIARRLNVSVDEYHVMLRDVSTKKIFSFEDFGINQDMLPVAANTSNTPLEKIQNQDLKQKLANEIAYLPEREKLVLSLYYDEELNLREVGQVLGVSESRISQLHSQAMVRLQARLANWK